MPHSILLVDDNDMYRGMLRSLLELHGFQIVPARNGTEGLACAANERVDAVVVDLDMPDMNGFDFCRRLRAQEQAAGRDVPVWIITGTFRPGLAKNAAAAGALPGAAQTVSDRGTFRSQLEQELQKREAPPVAGGAPETGGDGG